VGLVLFELWKKQTNAICIGGSVSTSHDVFFYPSGSNRKFEKY